LKAKKSKNKSESKQEEEKDKKGYPACIVYNQTLQHLIIGFSLGYIDFYNAQNPKNLLQTSEKITENAETLKVL